jgi:predicted ferric reductase
MRPFTIILAVLLAALTGLWLPAQDASSFREATIPIRRLAAQFTGVLGLAAMCIAMLLAPRRRRIKKPLGGLDGMHRLHRMACAGSDAAGHSPAAPAHHRSHATGAHRLARHRETMGESSFYAAAALITLALVKTVPYGLCRKIYWLLAVALLPLAVHCPLLFRFDDWPTPLGVAVVRPVPQLRLSGCWDQAISDDGRRRPSKCF